MNTETENSITPAKQKSKPSTDYLRISRETKKKILSDLAQLNRKDYGKTVTADQYISLAVTLLAPEHFEKLKSQSLTNKDRLELKYREYCKSNGKVSMDEFLGILLLDRKS